MEINDLIKFIRDVYSDDGPIPLHAPQFNVDEENYVLQAIKSTYVSSVGEFVNDFENRVKGYTGASSVVATVNGTSALHMALLLAGVEQGDLVITQPLTFVATCNAIKYLGADPVFCDVSKSSLGLSPKSVDEFLLNNADIHNGDCIYRATGQRIKAMMPVHTFGHPVELDELIEICLKWNISLVEDAAESLGSLYKGRHTGTLGDYAAISFNGNKIITTGGGGVILSKDKDSRAKHLTTTAKVSHPYEFYHDEIGFNYRMPNINAALGCAQLNKLDEFISKKRSLASAYEDYFEGTNFQFIKEPKYAHSNYWLNAVVCPSFDEREMLLKETNSQGVMTRPVWTLMTNLPMFKDSIHASLENSKMLEKHLVNLPSSVV